MSIYVGSYKLLRFSDILFKFIFHHPCMYSFILSLNYDGAEWV